MSKLDSLLERYASNLATRGVGAETIAARVREGVRFGAWLRGRRPRANLEAVGQDLVVRYLQTRSAFRSRATVAGRLSHMRCLGEFLVEEAIWRVNPLRWVRGPKLDIRHRLPRRIGREQLQALWKAAETRRQEHARYQSLCALGILYGTGLRLGELARLDVSDWDVEHFTLKIDGRKTGRERKVVVGEGVARCIEGYLPQRHNRLESVGRVAEQALLVNRQGVRLGSTGIGRLIGRLCSDAGLVRLGHFEPARNPMAHFPRIKAAPVKLPVFLAEDEVRRLLAQPQNDTVLGLRDRALFTLLYGTGIRASECAGLTENDVDLGDATIRVIGKGGHGSGYWSSRRRSVGRPFSWQRGPGNT